MNTTRNVPAMTTLGDYRWRIAGVGLVLASLAILISSPEEFSVRHLGAFLICLVLGVLTLSGFLGRSPVTARLLRAAREGPTSPRSDTTAVPAIVFRYPHRARVQTVYAVLGLVFIGIGILLGAFFGHQGLESIGVAGAFIGGGLFWFWFGYRYARREVSIDPQQIRARMTFRTISIPWDQIRLLCVRDVYILGIPSPEDTSYEVFGLDRRLSFSRRLTDADDLANTIRSATGLKFEH